MSDRRSWVIIGALGLTLIDQWTKALAVKHIEPFKPLEVTGFFNLVNVRNTGAAFSMFASMGNWFFVVVASAAVVFILYLILKRAHHLLGLGLILSGAIGNLWDRIELGYVRDFLDFHALGYHWPSFNVADSALTVGMGILILEALMEVKAHSRKGN